MLPDGTRFAEPSEFRDALTTRMPQFAEALTHKMLVYALGRGLESYDRRSLNTIVRNSEAKGYTLQALVFEIVGSLPFQSRRGER